MNHHLKTFTGNSLFPKRFKRQSPFFSMALDFDKIKYSKHDIRNKIVIPRKLTPLLAEDLGFHIGDGCMFTRGYNYSKCIRYGFCYCGNSDKDRDYFQNGLLPRKKELFNLDLCIRKDKNSRTIMTNFFSRAIFDFFRQLGIPSGKKTNLDVPPLIKNSNKEIKAAFLRGLAAADFCVAVKNRSFGLYPTICFVTASKKLCDDICQIIQEFDIPFTRFKNVEVDKRFKKPSTTYRVNINGRKRLKKWLELINFSDKRNLTACSKFF